MGLLSGKTALVTGAARGIGKALALRFAEEGANIAFTDLVIDENGEATRQEIEAKGVKCLAYASNAADFAETVCFAASGTACSFAAIAVKRRSSSVFFCYLRKIVIITSRIISYTRSALSFGGSLQFQNPCGKMLNKVFIVRHKNKRSVEVLQRVGEHVFGMYIQVVCRFV